MKNKALQQLALRLPVGWPLTCVLDCYRLAGCAEMPRSAAAVPTCSSVGSGNTALRIAARLSADPAA